MKRVILVFLFFTLILSVFEAQESQNLHSELPSPDEISGFEKEVSEENSESPAQKEKSASSSQNLSQQTSNQNKQKSSLSYFIFSFPKSQPFCLQDETSFLVSRSNDNGIFLNELTVSVCNDFDFSYGKNISAVQLTEDSISFIFENIFYFLRSYKKAENQEIQNPYFRLGADLYFNYECQTGVSSKYNLFYGLVFDFKPSDSFILRTRLFAGNRFSHILLGSDSFWIKNWDFQCDFKFIFKVQNNFLPFVSFSTFEEFRYPLFCAPIFSSGCIYDPPGKLKFAASIAIRYIDFFTLSSYADSWVVKLFASYKFL